MKLKLPVLAAAAALMCWAALLPVRADPPVSIVVELFTSEGCSSCPPADLLLSKYIKASPVAGVEVIALEEHVDYWNHGGWVDPFSSAGFSARQSDYSNVFHLDSVYTPQMVVDGQIQFVGSDVAAAREAIARAARMPKAKVSIRETAPAQLTVQVSHLPKLVQKDPTEVYLAVTEDDLRSSVSGGENARRLLVHNAVVRQLLSLGIIKNSTFTASPLLHFSPKWRRRHLHAVVFVQEYQNRLIVGASEISLS